MKRWLTSRSGRRSAVMALVASALAAAGTQHGAAQQIAFTMDDLPAHGPLPPGMTRAQVAEQVIAALREAGLPPTYGFINGVRTVEQPADVSVLDSWREGGNLLGNHTWSHLNLNQRSAQDFEAEVARNEPLLQQKMAGSDWHWLRYPFLAEGDTPEKKNEVRGYLAAHHYRIAAVTMSFGDYLWNEPYARCAAKGDRDGIARLEKSYLQAAQDEAAYELQSSKVVLGREIPFVLLMHIGAFDAHMLSRLLAMYKSMGFSFVSLETAEQDPFYRSDIDPSLSPGPQNLQAAAAGKGIALPKPPAPQALDDLCR